MIRALRCSVVLALLAGCTRVQPRQAFEQVNELVSANSGLRAQWSRDQVESEKLGRAVAALLQDELTAERATRIALLNNRDLQATFEELGIAQADLAQAARVSNPELELGWGFPDQSEAQISYDFGLAQDLVDLIVQPLRVKVGAAQLEQTKLQVGDAILRLAAETKIGFYTLQAREQWITRLRLIVELDRTAAELALRQHQAGTISDLELLQQQSAYAQSKADLALAESQARSDREALHRWMGLWGPATGWRAAAGPPEIPTHEVALDRLESLAVAERFDLAAGRWSVDLVGRALALKKGTRFFPVGVHVGVRTEREPEQAPAVRISGPTLALQIPLFDTGRASIARLEAQYQQSQRLLEALAIQARSEVREARDQMLAARDLAGYYTTVLLPLQARILELTLQHYNMMFKGAYELLLAKQRQVELERAAIEAWRDYWIARTRLELAVGGRLPENAGGSTQPSAESEEHANHDDAP